jgi:hypothetical protein
VRNSGLVLTFNAAGQEQWIEECWLPKMNENLHYLQDGIETLLAI